MNFLGMGPGELILIIIIALIVLGPGKLPEAARAVGKVIRDLRTISEGFQNELRRELNSASLKDEIAPVTETLSSLRASLNEPSVLGGRKQLENPLEAATTSPAGAQAEASISPAEEPAGRADTEAGGLPPPVEEPLGPADGSGLPVEYAAPPSTVTDQQKTE